MDNVYFINSQQEEVRKKRKKKEDSIAMLSECTIPGLFFKKKSDLLLLGNKGGEGEREKKNSGPINLTPWSFLEKRKRLECHFILQTSFRGECASRFRGAT